MADPQDSLLDVQRLRFADVRRRLDAETPGLFAVLDACDEPRVPAKMFALDSQQAVSLYQGQAQRDYWDKAPYLVHMDAALFDWLVEHLWDEPWGILLSSPATLDELRKHLRRYVLVGGEDGGTLLFRFYDPRVLPAWLDTCDAPHLEAFVGPVQAFLAADGEDALLAYRRRLQPPAAASTASTAVVVTDSQMKALARRRQEEFRRRLADHLLQQFAEAGMDRNREDLQGLIDVAMARARRYQLTRECDVVRYVELVCMQPGGFGARHPREVENILYDRRLPPEQRLDRLAAHWIASAANGREKRA